MIHATASYLCVITYDAMYKRDDQPHLLHPTTRHAAVVNSITGFMIYVVYIALIFT